MFSSNKKKYCPQCKSSFYRFGKCTDCGYEESSAVKHSNPGIEKKCDCGSRGRDIVLDGVVTCKCFKCYHKNKGKNRSNYNSGHSINELEYQRAMVEFYLEPLYLGLEPDFQKLGIAHDKLVANGGKK